MLSNSNIVFLTRNDPKIVHIWDLHQNKTLQTLEYRTLKDNIRAITATNTLIAMIFNYGAFIYDLNLNRRSEILISPTETG